MGAGPNGSRRGRGLGSRQSGSDGEVGRPEAASVSARSASPRPRCSSGAAARALPERQPRVRLPLPAQLARVGKAGGSAAGGLQEEGDPPRLTTWHDGSLRVGRRSPGGGISCWKATTEIVSCSVLSGSPGTNVIRPPCASTKQTTRRGDPSGRLHHAAASPVHARTTRRHGSIGLKTACQRYAGWGETRKASRLVFLTGADILQRAAPVGRSAFHASRAGFPQPACSALPVAASPGEPFPPRILRPVGKSAVPGGDILLRRLARRSCAVPVGT